MRLRKYAIYCYLLFGLIVVSQTGIGLRQGTVEGCLSLRPTPEPGGECFFGRPQKLDDPHRLAPRLRRLLSTRPPWER